MPEANKHRCQNCGNEFSDEFCNQCGQAFESKIIHFRSLIKHTLGDIFAFDSRAILTIKKLIFQPGYLTSEYLEGRRSSYVPPTRLYVFLSIIFFVLLSLQISQDSTRLMIYPLYIEYYDEDGLGGNLGVMTDVANEEANPIETDLITTISRLAFILLPVYAFLLKIFFQKRYYVEHLIFCIHIISFIFFVFISYVVLKMITILPPVLAENYYTILLGLIIPSYIFIALKNVYRNKWILSIIKFFGLFIGIFFCSIIAITSYSYIYNSIIIYISK